jgi:protein-histidine pros-kinase
MKLLLRFNLILILVLAAGVTLTAYFARNFLIDNARTEVLAQARLLLASAKSVRDYTADDLSPLLQQNPRHKVRFLAETIPFFAATTTLSKIKVDYPDFAYKEATLNPTNLIDRATDFESDVIHEFRDNPSRKETTGERPAAHGSVLYLAQPIHADSSCLECHGLPSAAPKAMIAVYGSDNGFGWKANETVGAQIVSVPLSMALDHADQAFHQLLTLLIAIAAGSLLLLNAAFYLIVLKL